MKKDLFVNIGVVAVIFVVFCIITGFIGKFNDDSVNTINGYSWSGPFANCNNLETLILRSNSVVSTSSDMSGLLSTTKIKSGGTGYIYVPSALIEDYKVATNWATVAS